MGSSDIERMAKNWNRMPNARAMLKSNTNDAQIVAPSKVMPKEKISVSATMSPRVQPPPQWVDDTPTRTQCGRLRSPFCEIHFGLEVRPAIQ